MKIPHESQNRMVISWPSLASCCCCGGISVLSQLLPAETLTYREVEGEAVATHVLSIALTRGAWLPRRTGHDPRRRRRPPDLPHRRRPHHRWPGPSAIRRGSMELAASRPGRKIVLTGHAQGKKVAKEFAGAGPAWNQLFQMGLGAFRRVRRGELPVPLDRHPGAGRAEDRQVHRDAQGRRKRSTWPARTVSAVHLRISLSGLLSIFWHGDYWYRQGDGRFLRYRGKNRPGGPHGRLRSWSRRKRMTCK